MESTEVFSTSIQLNHSLCDLSGHLTLAQLFLYMQEVAGQDSDRLGVGSDFTLESRVFWVLSRVALRVNRLPKWDEQITVRTWHGKAVRYIFPRMFTAEDASGACLVEASTLWMLIDRDTREIVFPQMRGIALPEPIDRSVGVASPGKIVMPLPLTEHATRSPVYSDYDTNGHMNNSRYPAWICDLFPPQMFSANYVREMRLNYVREIVQGESVDLNYALRGQTFAVRGSCAGEARFEAEGSFAPYGG